VRDVCSLVRHSAYSTTATATRTTVKQQTFGSSWWMKATGAALAFGCGFVSFTHHASGPVHTLTEQQHNHMPLESSSTEATCNTTTTTSIGQLSRACMAAIATMTTTTTALCKGSDDAAIREQSFIMVKPDGFTRGLCGDIIQRFEKKGYKLVAAKVLVPSEEIAKAHYAEHDGKPFFPKLVTFLTSGPVLALVFEGRGVIGYGRTMIGATNPLGSAPGTIRGDYGIDVGRNVIHGSDSPESAQREIALWFASADLARYERNAIDSWVYE